MDMIHHKHLRRWTLVTLVVLTGATGFPISSAAQPDDTVQRYLTDIRTLVHDALEASQAAEQAATVADVKRYADVVFQTVWGAPSGLVDERAGGAEHAHGWKTRWQVTFADFDSAYAARYGSLPPEIEDPALLGIVGRGRHVRAHVEAIINDESAAADARTHAAHVVNSLNNVIGWMKMDDGVTKGERQPRVDLTREWDAPIEFWMSTADTGWLHEVYAQTSNILKTNYDGDVDTARRHAGAMTTLIRKAIDGVDANGNGSVEPTKMEGGISTALQHAEFAGLVNP